MAAVQHQGSLTEQLRALVPIANFHGMYDAADYLNVLVSGREPADDPIVVRPPGIPKAIGGRPC